jgi:hypothetical protein
MSETLITCLPPRDVWIDNLGRGIIRHRAAIDVVSVEKLPEGGRILRVTLGDRPTAELRLDVNAAALLARSLIDSGG